jgi:ATP-dependent helicase/nuclease subunit A
MSVAKDHATAQQTLAARPDHHIHVEANAGSGKTRVLVSRVARLLLTKTAPDKILCLTYTKAAAGEMKSRLFNTLGEWAIADDAALTKLLNKLHNVEGESYSRDELAEARRLFARALETPGGLAVQTIHAFCQSLLQRFPLEAGLPPGFDIADDADNRVIAAEARRGLLLAARSDSALHDALAALNARGADSFDLIVRLATGKRLEFSRLLQEKGESGLSAALRAELGLSENESAAGLTESGWMDAPQDALRSAADTLATGIQTDQATAAAIHAALAAGTSEQAFDAYSNVFLTQAGEFRKKPPIGKAMRDTHAAIATLIDAETARMQDLILQIKAADTAEASEAATRISADYIRRYEAALRARRRLDYADLIAFAVKLLDNSEDRDWIRYKLDAGIDHVLVDEAQDNAPDQWQVIGALVEDYFSGSGIERATPKTVFTVGDEKQSIYSFQGAEPKQFLAWGEQVRADALAARQKFETPSLSVSFRSAAVILSAVDQAFEPERQLGETKAMAAAPETKFVAPEGEGEIVSADYTPSQQAFERYQTHQAAWDDRPGLVELWPALPREKQADTPDPAEPVDRESQASASHRLAGLVASEIRRILDDGDAVHDADSGALRPAEPKDILVLVSTRSGFFRELIRRLKQLAVPVAGADRMVLTEELAVQDLINLAEIALNPLDDLKLAEFLKTPFFDPANAPPPIDETTLFNLAHGRKGSLWQALRDSQDAALVEAREAMLRARNRIENAGVYGFFADFLNEISATGETRQKRLFARLGEEARDPVEEFLARAISYEQQNTASLPGFIADLKAGEGQIKREMEQGRGEVRVMTVHGSKGLEAPIVILPDTTQKPRARADRSLFFTEDFGLVWGASGKLKPALVETLAAQDIESSDGESARLLYVGLTRAAGRLLVCGWRRGHGEGSVDKRSWYERLDALWQGENWTEFDSPVLDCDGLTLSGRRFGALPVKLGKAADTERQISMPDWALKPAKAETGRGQTVAPSHFAETLDEGPTLSPLTDESGRRFRRGSLIHKLLEILPDLPDERRAEGANAYLAAQTDLDEDQRAQIAAETLAVIRHPDFAALFGPGSLAEVSLTGSAPGLPEGVILNGQVDRLVITDHEVLIVDYKTNRPPPTDAGDVTRLYLAQMAAYQALLRAIHPDRTVRCALIWTDGPRLMELDDTALADALAAGVKA